MTICVGEQSSNVWDGFANPVPLEVCSPDSTSLHPGYLLKNDMFWKIGAFKTDHPNF